MKHFQVSEQLLNNLYSNKKIKTELDLEKGYYHLFDYGKKTDSLDSYEGYPKSTYYYPNGAIAYMDTKGYLRLVDKNKMISHQQGQNPYQWMIVDALTNDMFELVILTGVAGSGKTFLSLAYALQVIENSNYNNIILSRPKQKLARDEGFLPGTQEDKIAPYMRPFYDNARSMGEIQKFKRLTNLEEDTFGVFFQPLEMIKGRSFENSIIICDEAEDMRYRELESLLTRVNNCKVILSGDIKQIDDKTFSKNNVPLTYTINKIHNEDFAAHINNPITSRKGNITKFVIDNFSFKEYQENTA